MDFIFVCPHCGVQTKNEPPHGWQEPCPMKQAIDQAHLEKLDAERMYYLRGGLSNERVTHALEALAGIDDDE